MPRPCSICTHPQRLEIDSALVAGGAFRDVAGRFRDVSKSSIERHTAHVGHVLVEAEKARLEGELEHGQALDDKLEALAAEFRRLARVCEKSEDLRGAVLALREMRETWKTVFEFRDSAARTARNQAAALFDSPAFLAFVDLLLDLLEPHPEALAAVLAGIEEKFPGTVSEAAPVV